MSSQWSVGINARSCFSWPGCPPRFLFDLCFCDTGLACGCWVLGGRDEFCGVMPTLASSFPMRSSSDSTKARTAGVISASSSRGIASGPGLADDIMYVVPENVFHVQIKFATNRRGL